MSRRKGASHTRRFDTNAHPHRSEVAVFAFGTGLLLAPTGPLSDVERGLILSRGGDPSPWTFKTP